MCHEFTAASLAAAGYNLDADYRDPKTGLRVAYADTSGYRIVEAWMVVGMFTEATEAILAAQNGETEHISPGSERADELKIQEADDILYSTTSTFTERKASSTHRFGAGAVAVAFGGDEIALDARKPGDVQQTLQVRDETYSGRGHSSIVHAVRGHGVAMLGAPGSPTLYGELDQSAPFAHPELELEPGWYRIDPGADIAWEVGPDTDPSTVASLTATHVQLIDANVKGSSMEGEGRRGDDATVLGDFDSKVARGDGKNGVETSTGRLPSSPWFGWATSEPESAIALSDQKPMTSP